MPRPSTLIFTLLFLGTVLLSSRATLSQSKPSNTQSTDKNKAQPIKVIPEHKVEPFDPSVSKEFMPVARRAFQAVDSLREHFWEDYDSDAAWTPRQMMAEKARDDLTAAANSSAEKFISLQVANYVFTLTSNRTLMRSAEQLSSAEGLRMQRQIQSQLRKAFDDDSCYTESRKFATTGEHEKDSHCGSGQTSKPNSRDQNK